MIRVHAWSRLAMALIMAALAGAGGAAAAASPPGQAIGSGAAAPVDWRPDHHCHRRPGYRYACHQGAWNWRDEGRYRGRPDAWRESWRRRGWSRDWPRESWRRRDWPREDWRRRDWSREDWPRRDYRRRYERDRPYWRRQPIQQGPSIYYAL